MRAVIVPHARVPRDAELARRPGVPTHPLLSAVLSIFVAPRADALVKHVRARVRGNAAAAAAEVHGAAKAAHLAFYVESFVLVCNAIAFIGCARARDEAKRKGNRWRFVLRALTLCARATCHCSCSHSYLAFQVTYFLGTEDDVRNIPGFAWWPTHDEAEFVGNLVGDVAWTIEPAFVLLSARAVSRAIEDHKQAKLQKKPATPFRL